MPSIIPNATTWTAAVDGTDQQYLGRYGHVADAVFSDQMPGGPLSMTCSLESDPRVQPQALDPGRRVIIGVGGRIQWEGILLQPVAGDNGWSVSADGAGTWGTRYQADYNAGGYTAENIIDRALGRGLRWVRGTVSGGMLVNPADSASQSITDFLNSITSPQSTTWRVSRKQAGWQVDLIPIPSTVTRLLITNVAAVRTLAGYINALYARYQVTADSGGTPATFLTATGTNAASIAKHDRTEDYWDLTSAGVMTGTTALGLTNSALAKYQAASYGGPFVVNQGQYLTVGGAPVDLASETAGEVVRLILADGPYGGEIGVAPPITFPVGQVQYNANEHTLQVTPFQSWRNDLGNVLGLIAPKAPA
jgi:hypothetical protein